MTEWAGTPIVDWTDESRITDPGGTAYRIRITEEDKDTGVAWADIMSAFLSDPRIEELESLVIGDWFPSYETNDLSSREVVESLVAASTRFPHLKALFLGDITSEECEISWIRHTDISPLFGAFPGLEHLGVRGATDLSLGTPHHEHLKTLVLESGGLPATIVQEVIAAELPALEHLELWLGTENYGGDATVDDLEPIFQGTARWPKLRYLGLRDSSIADAVATALADAPIVRQIDTLDLSLGTLGDTGAAALAASPNLAHLKKLDIHHHYVSPETLARLMALGIEVDADDVQKPDHYNGTEHRYVAVSE